MITSLTFHTSLVASLSVASAIALTACGPQGGEPSAPAVQKPVTRTVIAKPDPVQVVQRPVASASLGEVRAIEPITSQPKASGVGAVAGGVLGAVLGHQIGGGDGKKAATVVGAVGGAVAGNSIEKARSEKVTGYRVRVQMDNGESRTFQESNLDGLSVGDRVRVEGGQLRRV